MCGVSIDFFKKCIDTSVDFNTVQVKSIDVVRLFLLIDGSICLRTWLT